MIYIDCTVISKAPNVRAGIQRVTRSMATELCALSKQVVPAAMAADGTFRALAEIPQYGELPDIYLREPLFFGPGDTYLVMDSSWIEKIVERLEAFKPFGLTIGVVFYDLIPLTHPDLCGVQENVFADWLKETADHADYFACISKATQDELHRELRKISPEWKGEDATLFNFPLGADIPSDPASGAVRQEMVDFFSGGKPYLCVATVEIRKNHALLLDAFDSLWHRFPRLKLCFIGKEGWMVDDLLQRIAAHPQNGKQFRWFSDCSDAEVAWATREAKCTLHPSFVEGFGLPIIESFHAGTPVLASDIPVFREVAGDRAGYFDPKNPATLEKWIEQIETTDALDRIQPDPAFHVTTWKECAEALLERIQGADQAARRRLEPLIRRHRMKRRASIGAGGVGVVAGKTRLRDLLRLNGDELIQKAYHRFFRRPPDPDGENYCRHCLATGFLPIQLIALLRFSPEGIRVAEPLKYARGVQMIASLLGSGSMLGKLLRYLDALRSLPATYSMAQASIVRSQVQGKNISELQMRAWAHAGEINLLKQDARQKTKQLEQACTSARALPFSMAAAVPPYLARAEKRVGREMPDSLAAKQKEFYTYFSEIWGTGYEENLRRHYEAYLPHLHATPDAPLLDIGCGAGEFLSFLKQKGIPAMGIDLDAGEAARARERGLAVECADALDFLKKHPGRFSAISMLQVIEHIPPSQHMELLAAMRGKLEDDGLLLIETINPMHPAAFNGFYTDPTHQRPVPVDYLGFLAQWCGFKRAELLYVYPVPIYSGPAISNPALNYANYALLASPGGGQDGRRCE